MNTTEKVIGIDVGSTTVKCVVVDAGNGEVRWRRYQRHETRQAQTLFAMLQTIEADFPELKQATTYAFITGSGAGPLAAPVGARFIQEVNAVTLAVERLHPDVNSVIELGGQDAKVILFKPQPGSDARKVITSMNDKCASGTGATIDKCMLKVGMDAQAVAGLSFNADKLHHVAAKCGVFAETDIVNLIKAGVPSGEVMNSLADAIVTQNLSVLTRGNTLMPRVLLLGGPNTFLPFLQTCWRLRIRETWQQRGITLDGYDLSDEELIQVPLHSEFYAAFGAAMFGIADQQSEARAYSGAQGLRAFMEKGRSARLKQYTQQGLLKTDDSLENFRSRYAVPVFSPARFKPGSTVRVYIGIDGGSTSSKAVLLDEEGELLCKAYQLSKGNPIQDAKELLKQLYEEVIQQGVSLEVLGLGATGYAADVLDKALCCDANIVETIAHMSSARQYCGHDIDVICDIGGQDIKVLFLQDGVIKNFRLSNQCSAGNGMLLQAMAAQFGIEVQDYASVAFEAELAPRFSYGCAVFLDSDRVNFQREGFNREELFAGLAQVLPKNIWQYVVQVPRMSELGRKFVLQGGTQYNLAAVKAQVDYIKERIPDAHIDVHPHCGEAGAIGAALEARRLVRRRGQSRFIGMESAINLQYTTRTDESTRCHFCENNCSRTFIDTDLGNGEVARYIAGFSCEKGTVESKQEVVALHKVRRQLKRQYPNLVDYEASLVFRSVYKAEAIPPTGSIVNVEDVRPRWWGWGVSKRKFIQRPIKRSSEAQAVRRKQLRVGIPRALNIYTLAPFLRVYLETLGIAPGNIVFSDPTSEELWAEGGKYGSIDPCFPAKVSLAHVHQLLHGKQRHKSLDYIWFPSITHMPAFVSHAATQATCPVVAGTPSVVEAAFTKERNWFEHTDYIFGALNFEIEDLLRQQLFVTWSEHLGITEDENDWACTQAWEAMRVCDHELQRRGLELLYEAEANNKVILLVLGRPYHNDPGLNHDVIEEFQALGYPALSIRSIPKSSGYLERFFKQDLTAGRIDDVFDIRDVWPENYSVNSAQKVWAAKFAARHPNVAVLDLSSFKCGHDAPTYGIIDEMVSASGTPYMALHDIDANKPGGSIRIRVKTYAYALERYQEQLLNKAERCSELERVVAAKRMELLGRYQKQLYTRLQQQIPALNYCLDDVYNDYLNSEIRVGAWQQKPVACFEAMQQDVQPIVFYPDDVLKVAAASHVAEETVD